jgi:hypothetical protein
MPKPLSSSVHEKLLDAYGLNSSSVKDEFSSETRRLDKEYLLKTLEKLENNEVLYSESENIILSAFSNMGCIWTASRVIGTLEANQSLNIEAFEDLAKIPCDQFSQYWDDFVKGDAERLREKEKTEIESARQSQIEEVETTVQDQIKSPSDIKKTVRFVETPEIMSNTIDESASSKELTTSDGLGASEPESIKPYTVESDGVLAVKEAPLVPEDSKVNNLSEIASSNSIVPPVITESASEEDTYSKELTSSNSQPDEVKQQSYAEMVTDTLSSLWQYGVRFFSVPTAPTPSKADYQMPCTYPSQG